MTTKTTFGISQLLEAEREAQRIIAEARKEKEAKRKQAELEAAKEIAEFKAERESAFRKYEAEHGVSSTDYNKTLEEETKQKIREVQQNAKANENEVVRILLQSVQDVALD